MGESLRRTLGQAELHRLLDQLQQSEIRKMITNGKKTAAAARLFKVHPATVSRLYSSEKIMTSWAHCSQLVVALGKGFVVSRDAHVYAFGLKPCCKSAANRLASIGGRVRRRSVSPHGLDQYHDQEYVFLARQRPR